MSDMKCPFCQQELDTGNYYVHCHDPHCNITVGMEGTEEMWEALIRTRKALEVAKNALNDVIGCEEYGIRFTAKNAKKRLDQIKTALEQKE